MIGFDLMRSERAWGRWGRWGRSRSCRGSSLLGLFEMFGCNSMMTLSAHIFILLNFCTTLLHRGCIPKKFLSLCGSWHFNFNFTEEVISLKVNFRKKQFPCKEIFLKEISLSRKLFRCLFKIWNIGEVFRFFMIWKILHKYLNKYTTLTQ